MGKAIAKSFKLLNILDSTIVFKMGGRKYVKIPQVHRLTNKTEMKFVFWDGLGMGVVVLCMLSIFLDKPVGFSYSHKEIK